MGDHSDQADNGVGANEDVRKEVGRRIRQRREALGLSLRELGLRLVNTAGNPVPASQLGRWEYGVHLPERRMWRQLAAALETTIDAIFGGLTAEMPDESLADRLGVVEAELQALIRVLDLEAAVSEAVRGAEIGKRLQGVSLAEQVREAAAEPLREPKTKPKRRSGS